MVTVKRNVYFNQSSATQFEGEEIDFDVPEGPAPPSSKSATDVNAHTDMPVDVPAGAISPSKNNYSPPRMPSPPPLVIPKICPQRIQQPSHIVREMLSGATVSSTRTSDSVLPQGVQPPTGLFEGERSPSDDKHNEVECKLELEGQGEDELTEHALATAVSEAKVLELCMLNEAQHRPDWPLWEKVIEEELTMLHATGTWILENAPPTVNVIESKWVFKVKKDVSGNVVRYKAQLVVQGFSQVLGIDYFDTYAPITKLPSIHTILSITTCLDMEMTR